MADDPALTTLLTTAALLAASTVTPYATAVLADSPSFYWPLDETTGPVRDATGRAADSTVATAELGVPGAVGKAVQTDGLRTRVQIPYDPAMKLTGSYTVELWAKLPAGASPTRYPTLVNRGSVSTGHFGLLVWAGSDAAHLVNVKRNGINIPTARGLGTVNFRYLVFTWDADTNRYTWYVDGTKDVSVVRPALAGADTETGPLNIGAIVASPTATPNSYGKVIVDGLALYPRALSADQVAAHYAAAAPVVAPPPPPTRRVGGVAVGDLQPWSHTRPADYAALAAANATYVRTDIGWKYLQPTRTGPWRFDLYDPVLRDLQAKGLTYFAILHTVPGWANGNTGEQGTPTDPALTETYAYRTVRHFLPLGVKNYEIGNEVNYPHPGWTPTAAHYVDTMLKPMVAGARRASGELHLPVNLMFGSMAPGISGGGQDPETFLTEAYAHGAEGLTTSLAFHPYGGLNPAVEPNMIGLPDRLHAIMAAHGDGTHKIWATEYGIPTAGSNSWSEGVQAEWVADAYAAWGAKAYAGPMMWYSGRDSGVSATAREQHFGVIRFDGVDKPGYAALKAQLLHPG